MILKFSLKGRFFTTLFVVVAALAAGIFFYPQELSIFTSSRSEEVKLLFLGDMMFDRDIRRIGEQSGYDSLFHEVSHELQQYDLVIGNLEGPITKFSSASLGSEVGTQENTRFTFDVSIAQTLQENNITLLHIGNNHILDYGKEGLEETRARLNEADLSSFADVRNEGTDTIVYEIKGQRIIFVSYNEFLGSGYEHTIGQIKKQKKRADFLIVYAHWGIEYDAHMPAYLEAIARRFVEAGADLIVGTHPHVVGDVLQYKGKNIYYSLGNFIFDQYWDKSVRCGVVLEVALNTSNPITEKFLTPTNFKQGKVAWNSCE